MNFNMEGVNKTLGKLFTMLKVAEKDIQKRTNHVMMVKKTTHFKKAKGGGKARKTSKKSKASKPGPSLKLSVSSVRRRVTGRVIARST